MDRYTSDIDGFDDGSESTEPSRAQMQAIAALADGTNDAPEARAEIEADPRTRELLAQQTRAVALIRDAASDVYAPDALRARIDGMQPAVAEERQRRLRVRRPARRAGRASRRSGAFAGLAGAAAAIVLVLVLTLSGAGGAPTVAQAASLSTRGSTLAAPQQIAEGKVLLDRSESGVAFPYWEDHFHWRTTGARTDTVGNRHATTVFYIDRNGRRIAYSIVSGPPLQAPPGAQQITRNGVPMWTTTTAGGTTVVTWLRAGHSCVLASRDVAPRTLQALASWRANGSIPY
jgi:hypothetical protein